jgi:hypothetical protein
MSGPLGAVGGREVLRAADERDGRLHRGILGRDAGVVQRVEQHLRVGKIRPTVLAVARATVPVLLRRKPLAAVPDAQLEPIDDGSQKLDRLAIADCGERRRHAGVDVVGGVRASERAVIAACQSQERECRVDRRIARRIAALRLGERLDAQRGHRERHGLGLVGLIGRRRGGAREPESAGSLPGPQPRQAPFDGRAGPCIRCCRDGGLGVVGSSDPMNRRERLHDCRRRWRERPLGHLLRVDSRIERLRGGR